MRKSPGGWVAWLDVNRFIRWCAAVVGVLGMGLLSPCCLSSTSAGAQDGAPARASGTGRSEDVTTSIDTEGGAESVVAGKTATARSDSSQSVLTSVAHTPGPIMVVTIVIAVMSFYLIALVVWMALHYRTSAAIPGELVRNLQNLLGQTKFNEAYQTLVEDSSFLARVLGSGVRKLPAGVSQAQRAMELANEDATMEMEHRTTYLATVGTLGPMIGLVGTVYGMIMAFQVIALEGSSPQASQLAAGISTALYATLEGIAISIPAIFFYAVYRNRISRLSLEVEMAAGNLLELFAPGVRPGMPTAPSGIGAAPPSSAHPHPFALSATMAAAGPNSPKSGLPPATT